MNLIKIKRILLLPIGLLLKLVESANDGARDLQNMCRFRHAIIDRGCCIDTESQVGMKCHVLEGSFIVKSEIERFSYVGKNSIIQNSHIGSFCSIANDVCIGLGTHPINLFSTSPLFYRKSNTFGVRLVDVDYDFVEYDVTEVGHDVWIGARAIVLDGVKIGNGAIIAANALVTKDVPPYAIVGGVPANIIKYRFSPDKIAKLLKQEWWYWSLNDIKEKMNYLSDI